MTITLRSVSTYAGSPSPAGTISLTAPAGIQDKDLLILQGAKYGTGGTALVPPSGWTEVEQINLGPNYGRCGLWYRVADSEPGSYTCDAGYGNQCWGMACFSGARWPGIFAGTDTPDYTLPSVDSVVANSVWLGLIAVVVLQRSFSWPEGWTELWDLTYGTTTYAWVAITAATKVLPSAGATGTAVVTPSSTSNTMDRDESVILAPSFLPAWARPQAINVLLDEGAY